MIRTVMVPVGVLVLCFFNLCGCWALPADAAADFRLEAHALVYDSWKVADLLVTLSQNENPRTLEGYSAAADEFQRKSDGLGSRVLSALEKGDRGPLEALSEVYRSLDSAGRQALYPTIARLKASNAQEMNSPISDREMREYFPGYGYSESGYKYRKGRELEREFKGTTWQSEEQSINTTISLELTINIDLLDILKGLAASGAVRNLRVGRPYTMDVNGTPLLVVKVSFQTVKTVVTKTNRKFDVNKIWFELMRAKWGFFSSGPWELVGKTYVIAHEPTGEHVVTELGVLN